MNRRNFISNSALFTSGLFLQGNRTKFPLSDISGSNSDSSVDLYEIFRNPGLSYHPYVRWWWNGDKVEAKELVRELRLLKAAGIGGVEINPIEFPTRSEGDDLGKPSLKWLSNEWIDMLKVVFDEAKSLGMTCDMLVGSGWPFGAEYLKAEERSEIVVIAVKKLTGPLEYEVSKFDLFKEADPAVSSPFSGRTMQMLSLKLVPDPLSSIDQITDLSDKTENETFKISVPEGKHALYALIKISGFMQVINGAPGATGPVLDHYNESAVKKYLNHMSDAIEKRIGPLSGNIRALFTDSMELEGANWSAGLMDEFQKRHGYDLFPYLPFILFKTGAMGNVTDFKYGVGLSADFENMVRRMRYDFEFTKAKLLEERFIKTYVAWCRELGVKSRAQAYGRSFFPLESSFSYDIPECESWTMNWLKHKIGEEMTDTYTVFNTTLENLKIGGDQSAISGVSHSIFHGFNYSPPEAPYPGWIRYGGYYNEKNTWWPWFNIYNEYKGRMSALLQHVTMFTDIAILPPQEDMWSLIGSQMEPFPSITHVEYMTLVWETINKNGSGCDYVSERIIRDSVMKDGNMIYGSRKYHTLFLIQVDSLDTSTAQKLLDFVEAGGRILCIETYPGKSLGWKKFVERDREVQSYVEKMKTFPDRFILLKRPEKDFIRWYKGIQKQFGIEPYLKIENPDPYVFQNRYCSDDGLEIVFILNSHIHNSHQTRITFSKNITANKHGWIWNPENGDRYRITLAKDNSIDLNLGPADSFIFVFDNKKSGPEWKPLPTGNPDAKTIENRWSAEFIHCHDGTVKTVQIDVLKDLKEMTDFVNFAGTITYNNTIEINDPVNVIINLGKVYGISELKINGHKCSTKWYGRRIDSIGKYLVKGNNTIEIMIVTSMGNYMKSLTTNPIAQYWTNEKTKTQPLQSMGLIGPVTLYKDNKT